MTELGGHCLETLLEAFEKAGQDDRPRFFIAYTVKGLRLPFQGHKDNHAGLMTPAQIAELRERLGVVEGEEWDPLSGLSAAERTALKGLSPARRSPPRSSASTSPRPSRPRPPTNCWPPWSAARTMASSRRRPPSAR
jgi:pyruvate dehydrogenase complex dehydrogenase (E1) component